MARTGKITYITGIGKISKKPFAGLKLEVGEWTKLYFVDSQFEMKYIEKYLNGSDAPNKDVKSADDVDLDNDWLND